MQIHSRTSPQLAALLESSIASLSHLAETTKAPSELAATLSANLEILRKAYRHSPALFAPHIPLLRRMASLQRAAEEFLELEEDLAEVAHSSEAAYLLEELLELKPLAHGSHLLKLIDREIRHLRQRFGDMQSEFTGARINAALRFLTIHAPTCRRCGATMTLRERKRDQRHFWGCPQFPSCASIRSLSRREREVLEGAEGD